MNAVRHRILCRVGEAKGRAGGDGSGVQKVRQEAVPGDLAEADDDADAGEGGDLVGEMVAAVADLLGEGLVTGRGAADDGGDPGVAKLEAVVAIGGAGLAGEAELVKDGVHEVAGAVSGEGAAGAVGAVGAGGESKDQDAGARISEAGDGARPVGLVDVGAAAGFADGGAVGAEPWAALAVDDSLLHLFELRLLEDEGHVH